MKLMSVKCVVDYVIAVEDDANHQDAIDVAADCFSDAIRDLTSWDIEYAVAPYEPGSVIGWDGNCIPYGGDGETRTQDYLAG